MFKHVGKRVKTLAVVLCWIGILGSLGAGVFLYLQKILPWYWCAGIGVGGVLVSWLSSLLLYTIGDTNARLERIEGIVTPKPTYMEYIQDVQSTRKLMKCEQCGKQTTELIPAKLVDQMGTRYRKVCRECFAAYPFELEEENS